MDAIIWKRFTTFAVLTVFLLTLNESKCMSLYSSDGGPNLSSANDSFLVQKSTQSYLSGRLQQSRTLVYTPSYYDKCGKKYYCFPKSDNRCFGHKNCTYLVLWTFIPNQEYIQFTIMTQRLTDKKDVNLCNTLPPSNTRFNYIAIGFSGKNLKVLELELIYNNQIHFLHTHVLNIYDIFKFLNKKSDRFAVVECSISGLKPNEFTREVTFAWSSKTDYIRWNYTCNETTNIGKLIQCNVNLDRDSLLCEFKMKRRLVFSYDIFNFDDSLHFIHMTSGCDRSEITSNIFHHGGKFMSSENLVRFNPLEKTEFHSFRSNYAIWHGGLMLLAWWILVPNGMFVSRYFKESFVEISIFKYRLWFAGHSIIMITAFLITLGALGSILKERAEVDFAWPTEKSTLLHFNLGFAAVLLFISQICIGWIRCHGRKLRRSFTTFHLFCGTACYTISMVCIGLSFGLGMPCSIRYYAIASGLWTFTCHVAMTIHFYLLDKQLGLYVYRAFYPFPIPPVTYDELPGTKIRASIFFVHLTGCIVISSAILYTYLSNDEPCKR